MRDQEKIINDDDVVINLSQKDYEKSTGKTTGFKDFFLDQTPKIDDLDLKRDKSLTRTINL